VTIRTAELRPFTTPRPGWWLKLVADDGLAGVGECTPHPGFGAGWAVCEAALAALSLAGRPLAALDALTEGLPPELAHAVESAALDLKARRVQIPLSRLLGAAPAESVAAHTLLWRLEQADEGALALKVKLRGTLAESVAWLRAVRGRCPTLPLRLDANARFEREEAAAWLDALAPFEPEWVEQPTASVEDFAWLRARSAVPLAADESVGANLDACLALADVLVVKPMFVGGPRRAMVIAAAARAAGRGVCVTHALGTAVERAGALQLAAALADGAVHGVGHGLMRVPQTPSAASPW
jgi:L-Ala-D/L-Glu epimerase